MASSGGMKGFFREKKKSGKSEKSVSGGISKPKSSSKSTPKPKHSASDLVQPPAASLDLQDDYEYDEKEEVLRQFDMNMAYGPCLGMTRLERWERADAMGLHPQKKSQIC